MMNKIKTRPAQCCEKVIASEEGEVVCPSAKDRSSMAMKKKRQLLIK